MAAPRVVNKESDGSSNLGEGVVIKDPGFHDISSHEDSDNFDPELRAATPTPARAWSPTSSQSLALPHNTRQRSDSIISKTSTTSNTSIFGTFKRFIGKESTNKKLEKKEKEIQDLSNENKTLRKSNTKLADEITILKKECREKDVQFQGIQMSLGVYQKKLEEINGTQFKGTLHGKNILVGNNSIMVINADVNDLLLSYNQNLKQKNEEFNIISKQLTDVLKSNVELASTQQEIVDSLSSIKSLPASGSIDLEYTKRLVDPTKMMGDCVRTINELPKGKYYGFNEMPQEGQLGIFRLLKLYKVAVVTDRLAGSLGYTEQLDDDRKEQDQCGALLVEWVHHSPNNTVEALMDMFPQLRKQRMVRGSPGQFYSMTSLAMSTIDLSHDDMREDLLPSVKSMHDKMNSIEAIVSSSSADIKEIKNELTK